MREQSNIRNVSAAIYLAAATPVLRNNSVRGAMSLKMQDAVCCTQAAKSCCARPNRKSRIAPATWRWPFTMRRQCPVSGSYHHSSGAGSPGDARFKVNGVDFVAASALRLNKDQQTSNT
jgi:hypothetical protein